MSRWRWLPWAAAVVALDQLSKAAVSSWLAPGASVPVAGGWLRLTYVRNKGAAFGLFFGQTGLFVAASLAVLVLTVALSRRPWPYRSMAAALGLTCGGALANLVDRLRVGAVVDFIDLGWWPVFNLADAAIVLGVGLLGWGWLGLPRRLGRSS